MSQHKHTTNSDRNDSEKMTVKKISYFFKILYNVNLSELQLLSTLTSVESFII